MDACDMVVTDEFDLVVGKVQAVGSDDILSKFIKYT